MRRGPCYEVPLVLDSASLPAATPLAPLPRRVDLYEHSAERSAAAHGTKMIDHLPAIQSLNTFPRSQRKSPLNAVQALLFALLFTIASPLRADVTVPPIFGDHMVLQSGVPLTVWGCAEPVTVTVRGKNTLVFSDVLVGEVWLCSGQSNMEFGVGATSLKGITLKDEPQIRLFTVPHWIKPYPSEGEMAAQTMENPLSGKWVVATVANVMKGGPWQGFSAVGYYFGDFIHDATKKPVGMIAAAWGGTPATPWISLEGLQSDPRLKGEAESVPRYRASYAENLKKYAEEMEKWNVEVTAWEKKVGFPLNEYARHVKDWGHEADKLKAAGQTVPPRPEPPPREPRDMANNNQSSSVLFNGMIAPLIPYG